MELDLFRRFRKSVRNFKADCSKSNPCEDFQISKTHLDHSGSVKWSKLRNEMRATIAMNNGDDGKVFELLQLGAESFGFWPLDYESLAPLVKHILEENSLRETSKYPNSNVKRSLSRCLLKKLRKTIHKQCVLNLGLLSSVLVFFFCCLYVFLAARKSKSFQILGWWIVLSRASGLATLIWTSTLLFSMSRTILREVYGFSRFKFLLSSQKLHYLGVINLLVNSILHTVVHVTNTVPALIKVEYARWNDVFRCARSSYEHMMFFESPDCPLKGQLKIRDVLTSTVSLSGMLLCAILTVLLLTSIRCFRRIHYNIFHFVHILLIPIWLLFLYLHGSSQFLGIGIPLVVPVCGPFLILYCLHKFLELVFSVPAISEPVQFLSRETIYLRIPVPLSFSSRLQGGMFCLLNVSDISRWEWHPFSISSFNHKEGEECYVAFLISARGDWTKKLANACKEKVVVNIRIAGPYCAPAQGLCSGKSRNTLIAIGGGVGITPFLSAIQSLIKSGLPSNQLVYVYWVTRNAMDFIHASSLITEISRVSQITLKLFITFKPTFDIQESSYIFWKAVKHLRKEKQQDWAVRIQFPLDLADHSVPLIPLTFRRPDWYEEFSNIISPGDKWVFVCGGSRMRQSVQSVCDYFVSEYAQNFIVIPEEY